MNQYSRLYTDLLKEARQIHCKVHHVDNRIGDPADFYPYGLIRVPKKCKNTKYGCYLLAHELGHAVDFLHGRFKKWFKDGFKKNEWVPPAYIRKMEMSAEKFARRILESRKISTKNIYQFNPLTFDMWMIPYWTFKYNGFSVKSIDKEIRELHKQWFKIK